MNEFKQYKRKGLSEMRQLVWGEDLSGISISDPDKELKKEFPSVFMQGYIARNPKNHADMWYVAKDYFDENLEPVESRLSVEVTYEMIQDEAIEHYRNRDDADGRANAFIAGGLFVLDNLTQPQTESKPQYPPDDKMKRDFNCFLASGETLEDLWNKTQPQSDAKKKGE